MSASRTIFKTIKVKKIPLTVKFMYDTSDIMCGVNPHPHLYAPIKLSGIGGRPLKAEMPVRVRLGVPTDRTRDDGR